MSTPQSTILTQEHYAQLQNALDQAKRIESEIALATQAGSDVTQAKQTLADAVAKIRQIKAVYFPGQA